MTELEKIQERAILVAADTGEYDIEISLDELEELANSAEVTVVGRASQKRESPDPGSFLGKGRLEEIRDFGAANEVNLLIFDQELSTAQIRNIEEITDIRTIDRTMLILDIFGQRAKSSEGRLQVELAQQRYMLPRLMGMGKSLSRLGGGGGGAVGARRGAGETKLETDRRHIRRRISTLEEQLEELERRRGDVRKRRKKNSVQTVAIVGYTNVGKSTLLNALTQSEVLAEDMLFATLDPTARKLELPDGRNIVMVDTVGLIRRLPHHLVEAFKSTLEEARDADLVLNVCDASSPDADEQAAVAADLLGQLQATSPVIVVLNKCDLVEDVTSTMRGGVRISAKTGMGFDALLKEMQNHLPPTSRRMTLLVPYDQGALLSRIRENGKIFKETFEEKGVMADALVDVRLQKEAAPYAVEQA